MGKRISGLDTLGEVRRAMRILRRVERWLMQCERDEKRSGLRKAQQLAQRQARERRSAQDYGTQG